MNATRVGLQQIKPYIHPDHWGGHTFAGGPINAEPPDLFNDTHPRVSYHATTALQQYLNKADSLEHSVREVYAEGAFDPRQYPAGTIIAYRAERLLGRLGKQEIDLEDIEAAQVDGSLPSGNQLGDHVCIETFSDDTARPFKIEYRSSSLWGVVARPGSRSPAAVIGILAMHIEGERPDVVVAGVGGELPGPLPVGVVGHSKALGVENISRINRLEVRAIPPL